MKSMFESIKWMLFVRIYDIQCFYWGIFNTVDHRNLSQHQINRLWLVVNNPKWNENIDPLT